MRKSVIILLALIYSFTIHGQNDYTISGVVIQSNDIPLDRYGALLLDDSCAFHIVNRLGEKINPKICKWSFEVESEKGNYVKVESESTENYGIVIDDLSYISNIKRYNVANDSSTYYQGRVVFEGEYQGESLKIDKVFYLNLLPAVPTVKVLDITWADYDEEWHIYDEGYMTIQVNNCRSDFIFVMHFDITLTAALTFFFEPDIDYEKGIGLLPFYDGDGRFCFSAGNSSGFVDGDTIYTSKVVTSISSVKMDNVPFYPNPVRNVLYVQEEMNNIFPVSIYDCKGRLVKYVGEIVNHIDVSNLSEGVYFVSYNDMSANNKQTFKMIKN